MLLTQEDLAERWKMSAATLERYRHSGEGPVFLKIIGAVRYRLSDIELFESGCEMKKSERKVK